MERGQEEVDTAPHLLGHERAAGDKLRGCGASAARVRRGARRMTRTRPRPPRARGPRAPRACACAAWVRAALNKRLLMLETALKLESFEPTWASRREDWRVKVRATRGRAPRPSRSRPP